MKLKINIENFGKYVGYNCSKDKEIENIDNFVNIISCFTDTPKSVLWTIDYEDLAKAEDEIIKGLNKVGTIDEPKGKVSINGKEFIFDKSLKTLNLGQVIDIKRLGDRFYDNAPYVMSKLYTNDKIDSKEAEKLFIDNFPIEEYEACCRFFFQKYENWKTVTALIQEIAAKEVKEKELRYGTSTPTAFILWQRTLIEMWTTFRLCFMVRFYIGRNFFTKKVKGNALNSI